MTLKNHFAMFYAALKKVSYGDRFDLDISSL